MGEENMKLVRMMRRLHEKKCKKTGRTKEARGTADLLDNADKIQGISACNPTHHTCWENDNEFSKPGHGKAKDKVRTL